MVSQNQHRPSRRRPANIRGLLAPGYSAKSACSARRSTRRSAFTLIEMLVVVTIMMILVGAAATMMRPATEERRIREAARAINVYLGSARNRAMETGRPCGVMFRLLRDGSGTVIAPAAVTLDQCEVPPSYCGQTEYSRVSVTDLTGGRYRLDLVDGGGTAEPFPESMVQPDDIIQLNCQGPWYSLMLPSASSIPGALDANNIYYSGTSSVGAVLFDAASGQITPWSATPQFATYRIIRRPVKCAAQPLQLPATSVVDMQASSIGAGAVFGGAREVIITFAPNGAVERVYSNGVMNFPTDPIYLLVGKRERVENHSNFKVTPTEPEMTNYQDLNNLWIVINPHTGLVTSDNVASSAGEPDAANAIDTSRSLAAQAQGIGGR